MYARELSARPSCEYFVELAQDLLQAYRTGEAAAMARIQDYYSHQLTWSELREAAQRQLRKAADSGRESDTFSLSDAQLLLAREHGFASWRAFEEHLKAVVDARSPVFQFESAADAVITGDAEALERLLRENPELARARSTREHHSTLLHYVSANGVEDFRQKTPGNAVEITRILLRAGAEVDAENNPGRGTTLGLVATSYPPAAAGLQIALLETLLDAGASADGIEGGWNPVTAALANGRGDAAEFLAGRGARLDLEAAAGTGRIEAVRSFFHKDGGLKANATQEQLRSGFAWACEYGRTSVVDFLLQKGVTVDARLRHNGQTGLHWAAYNAHPETVKLLLERNAPVNAKDESFGGTPLGWALYAWADPAPETQPGTYYDVVALLIAGGAAVDLAWLADPDRERPILEKIRADPRMLAALGPRNATF